MLRTRRSRSIKNTRECVSKVRRNSQLLWHGASRSGRMRRARTKVSVDAVVEMPVKALPRVCMNLFAHKLGRIVLGVEAERDELYGIRQLPLALSGP